MSETIRVLSEVSNFTAVYLVTLMARCALMSLPVLGLILLLRATVFRNSVLLKGIVWLLILVVPFFGKLRLYYEVWPFGMPFVYCQYLPTDYPLLRWGYLMIVLCLLIRAFVRRRRTKRLLWYTTRSVIAGQAVYLTDAPVSPFVIGLIKTKIILPNAMIRALSAPELEMIVLHERMHIRLGHLWIFLVWNVFSAVYWLNPLLFAASGLLREDMEQICDYETMERGHRESAEYGELLLKSMRLLQDESIRAEVMFFGEGGYHRTKRRFEKIAAFHSCHRRVITGLLIGPILLVAAIFLISIHSWPCYTILPDITVGDEKGNVYADEEEAVQAGAVIREGDELVIDAEKLRTFLPDNFPEESYVYFYYDTVMKLPGMGVAGRCAWVESLPLRGRIRATEGKGPWWDQTLTMLYKAL